LRIIKFRGLRTDGGGWVIGDLINLHDGRKFIINNQFGACIDDKGNFINTESPFVNEVHPEKVSQFTGLIDKNLVEIYEGDIIRFEYNSNKGYSAGEVIGEIMWSKGGYYVVKTNDEEWNNKVIPYPIEIEVIGNIHV
jgi:uncharacterized phage protein (TIGR01671 family)